MISCELVGKAKKPYEIDGKKGLACRVSVHIGEYVNDPRNGIDGEGEQFAEYRCPERIVDLLKVGDSVMLELDDKMTRVKSAAVRDENGSFFPVE